MVNVMNWLALIGISVSFAFQYGHPHRGKKSVMCGHGEGFYDSVDRD